ncbi:MAG: hypothetical protein WAR37_01265 [Candidatus Microsaccharimonas sp.]
MINPSEIPLSGDPLVRKGVEIRTDAFARKKIITTGDLNNQGLYVDDYDVNEKGDRTHRIVVSTPEKESALRILHGDPKSNDIFDLPTLRHFTIDPISLRDAAKVSRLSQIKKDSIVEISGLGAVARKGNVSASEALESFDATRQLYSQALRHSVEQGHRLWVMNIDDDMQKFLTRVLGPQSYSVIGEKQKYIGDDTTPVALDPLEVTTAVLRADANAPGASRFTNMNKEDIKKAFQGIDTLNLKASTVKLLHENDIETTTEHPHRTQFNRLMRNKAATFYGFILGYSALRFTGAGSLEEFEGSVPAFAAIDIATAFTQVGSMEMYLKGKTRPIRLLGVAGTAASFAAPYMYFYANGQDYPWYANVVAGGAVALGAVLETKSSLSDSKRKNILKHSDVPVLGSEPNGQPIEE